MKINELRQMCIIHDALSKRGVSCPDYQTASIRRQYKDYKDYDCYDFFAMYLYTAGCLLMCMIWLYLRENNIQEIDEKELAGLLYKLANDKSVWKTYTEGVDEPFGLFYKCIDEHNASLPALWYNDTSPDLVRKSALAVINSFFSQLKDCECAFSPKPEAGKLYIYNAYGHFVVINDKGYLVFDPAGKSITRKTYFGNGATPLKNVDWKSAMYYKVAV